MLIRECTADDVEPLEELSPSGPNGEHARRLEQQTAGLESYLRALVPRRAGGPRRCAMARVRRPGRPRSVP